MTSLFESPAGAFPRVTLDDWKKSVEKALKGEPFERKLMLPTPEGTHLKPLYTRDDASADAATRPGASPFTRGYPAEGGAIRRGWLPAARLEHPSARHANALALEDLAGGAGALEVFVVRASRARASESTKARARVVRGGTWVEGAADLASLLGGVHWGMAPVAVRSPGDPTFACALVGELARRSTQGANGLFAQCDPFEDLVGTEKGDSAAALDPSIGTGLGALVSAVVGSAGATSIPAGVASPSMVPSADARPWLVSSETVHRAGAHAVQEVAFVAAGLVDLLRVLGEHGVAPGAGLRAVELRLAVGSDFFTEISKARALRRVTGRILEALGKTESASSLLLSAVTSELSLSRLDPWVNLLRGTEQAAAAVLAGVDKLIVLPFDLRVAGESRFGHRMARNAQSILAEECALAAVADPAGGSWYVEKRTEEIAEEAWKLFVQWEAAGGLGKALEAGLVQSGVEAAWEARRKSVARRKEPLLGASEYPLLDETRPLPDDDFDAAAFLAGWDARARDASGAASNSAAPAPPSPAAASGTAPAAGAMPRPLPRRALGEPFEKLRDSTDALTAAKGTRPVVFLALHGAPGPYATRLAWVRNLVAAGGFGVAQADPQKTLTENLELFRRSKAATVILVATDELYDVCVPESCAAYAGAGAREVWVAGSPREKESTWRAAGVAQFAFAGSDVPALLRSLLTAVGGAT